MSGASFTIDNTALKRMAAQSNMAPAVPIFTKIFSTLNARPDSDKATQILAKMTTTASHETTQHFCYVTGQEDSPIANCLLINLGGVKDASTRPLFHSYKTSEVHSRNEMFYLITLNDQTYASVLRKTVIDKLNVKDYIKNEVTEGFLLTTS